MLGSSIYIVLGLIMKKSSLQCAIAATLLTTSFCNHAIDLNSDEKLNARFDIGASFLQLKVIEDHDGPSVNYGSVKTSPIIGFGINKKVSANSLVGTKIELQRIEGSLLTTFRAIDYRYILDEQWQIGAFIGAARYDYRSPAYGYTVGFGGFYQPKGWKNWSIGTEMQLMDKIARDKIHPDDLPASTGPDTFTNMIGLAVTLSYNF